MPAMTCAETEKVEKSARVAGKSVVCWRFPPLLAGERGKKIQKKKLPLRLRLYVFCRLVVCEWGVGMFVAGLGSTVFGLWVLAKDKAKPGKALLVENSDWAN